MVKDMIFEILNKSAIKGELILIDGGLCHWHLRRDGQITIKEIIVLPEQQRQGIGTIMLAILKTKGADSIFAKCPAELSANGWYEKREFILEGQQKTKSGVVLNLWRLYRDSY